MTGGRVVTNRLWYVRRGDQVKGPFAAAQMRKYGALGRIRETDELSTDQKEWRAAIACYELFPKGRMDARKLEPGDDERLHNNRHPHTSSDHPAEIPSGAERRTGQERRASEPPEVLKRREQRERVLESLWSDKQSERFPTLAVIGVVICIAVLGWFLTPSKEKDLPTCDKPAQTGVNWDNCRKENAELAEADLTQARLRNTRLPGANLLGSQLDGADLSYANLLQANLSYASLKTASLKGTNLKFADLSNANLSQADLSYADLSNAQIAATDFTGALLSNAIWIDGKPCVEGSVGQCVQQ